MVKKKSYILVADDNPTNLQLLVSILSGKGFRVGVVENGMQVLRATKENLPDLILLDVMMPEMDGFATCRQLKASAVTKDIPVIFLTAKTEKEEVIKGLELGAVDYITKPFNSTELLIRVKTQLELKNSKDLIQKISQERMELIHILCHDLVNPIGISRSLVEDLEATNIDERKEIILRSLNNGIKVINLVRDMQFLEKQKLRLENVDLNKVLNISYQMLEQRIAEKGIELIVSVPDGIMIQAEETSLINSVLNNILTNAIKFSYPGSQILVNTQLSPKQAMLSIKDYGIGMSKGILESVFKVGKSTSREGTAGERGTGFGMPIVKKFIIAYGGSMELFSKDQQTYPTDHGTEIKLFFNRA